jgi:signal transduction histidine kinase
VQANVQILREVLSNAIDNALKYTPAGGLVLVEARLIEASLGTIAEQRADTTVQMIELAITDTGPGIPPQDLLHLFERRYRGVQAQTDIPGSGLGLSIARALVTQMNGEIEVLSPARPSNATQHMTEGMVARGVGTSVIVRLAIAQTDDSRHEALNQQQ